MPLIHKTLWLVKESVEVVVGESKYYGHYKMTPASPPSPNCRIQDVTLLALFVHLSGLFISFYFHAFNTKTLWLVKEAVVVVVGGLNIMAIIK